MGEPLSTYTCRGCDTTYAVRLWTCPRCKSTNWRRSVLQPKITRHNGTAEPEVVDPTGSAPEADAPRETVDKAEKPKSEEPQESSDTEGDASEDDPSQAPPSLNARRADWLDYAHRRAPHKDHSSLTKAELIEKFGG